MIWEFSRPALRILGKGSRDSFRNALVMTLITLATTRIKSTICHNFVTESFFSQKVIGAFTDGWD
jgi:hypothetical protein